MLLLEEVRKASKLSKELVTRLAKAVLGNPKILSSFKEDLKNAKLTERGACMEVLEYASKENPAVAKPHIETVIGYLSDKAPKVKWESARILGNIAQRYPEDVAKSVDELLANTKDNGTVVRWSAAYALSEIAKYNIKQRSQLLKHIDRILKSEGNGGVKNVYLKALKFIEKTS